MNFKQYQQVHSKLGVPHNNQNSQSVLQGCEQLNKVRHQMSYSKYLAELRNQKTRLPFTKYCKLGVQPSESNPTIFPFQKTALNTFYRSEQNTKREFIKLTLEWNEDIINEDVLNISQKMDYHLENSLGIPIITAAGKSKQIMKSQQSQISTNTNDDQNVQSFLSSVKHELSLSLLEAKTESNIKKIAEEEVIKIKGLNRQKQKSTAQVLFGQLGFKIRKLRKDNRIFDKTQTLEKFGRYRNNNKQNISKKKINRVGEKLTQTRSALGSESELGQVFKKYNSKMQKYHINKGHLMTKTREEAIFYNELVRKAGKKRSYDILSALVIRQRARQNQQREAKEGEQESEPLKKIPNAELAKNFKRKFEYLNQLGLEKL